MMGKKKTEDEKANDRLEKAYNTMEKELDEMEEVECLSDIVTKEFEAEGYKQNNLWEYDWEGDIMFGSFIDSNLDGVVVFFPEDLEFIEDKKEKKKNGKR